MKRICLTFGLLLAITPFVHAQWTLTSDGNNTYNTNPGSVLIGVSSPRSIFATSPLFPSAVPKQEIVTGTTDAAYSELITLRHSAIGSGAVARQLGYLFKLSNENNSAESNKMGGLMVESSDAWANHFSLSLITANVRRLTIDETGNVGIGTNDPDAKLTVYMPSALGGTVKNSTLLSSVGGKAGASNSFKNNIWLVRNSAGSDWYSARLHDGISIDASFLSPQTDTRTWWERDPRQDVQSWGTGMNTYLTIDNGNVLIGKTTQTNTAYKLDVAGGVRANQIVVNTTGADFVFDPSYRLVPLPELQKYIDKNHHLPEIPSAKQMQSKGLNVGDNQTKLLQKVEELTLYLIEEHQKNVEQSESNRILKEQLAQLQADINTLKTQMKASTEYNSNTHQR